MAARSIWKGYLRPAVTEANKVYFHKLNRETGSARSQGTRHRRARTVAKKRA